MTDKVNVIEKFSKFSDEWSPKIAATINDFAVKLAKIQGEFVWHHHEEDDELFWVIKGRLIMQFRDHEVVLEPGEFIVVKAGVEHRPVAPEEVWVALVERTITLNTGNVQNERTVEELDWV